jgi:hypothetical protein
MPKLKSNLAKIYNIRLNSNINNNNSNILNVSYSIETNNITKIEARKMKLNIDNILSDSNIYTDIVPNILDSTLIIKEIKNHELSSIYL